MPPGCSGIDWPVGGVCSLWLRPATDSFCQVLAFQCDIGALPIFGAAATPRGIPRSAVPEAAAAINRMKRRRPYIAMPQLLSRRSTVPRPIWSGLFTAGRSWWWRSNNDGHQQAMSVRAPNPEGAGRLVRGCQESVHRWSATARMRSRWAGSSPRHGIALRIHPEGATSFD